MTRAQFLRALFLTGYIDLRAILNDDRKTEFVRADQPELVDRFAERYADRDVYVGIAERLSSKNGKAENCGPLRALFADIDLKDYDGDKTAARQKLDVFPVAPSIVIASGGGWHCYWLLKEPLDLQNGGAANAKTLLRRLATAVGGDLNAAEPARILRVPGTQNQKYDPPRDVVIESFNEKPIPLSVMEANIDLIPETRVLPQEKSSHKESKALKQTIKEGERNKQLISEAGRLRQRGHSQNEILALLRAMNKERVTPPLPDGEVETIAKSAAGYEPGDEQFAKHKSGNRKGQIVADSQHNIRLAIGKMGLAFRYNAFADLALVRYDGVEKPIDDSLLHRAWLQIDERFHFRPPIDFFQIVINDFARRDTFHPVRDYLNTLTWDRTERIDGWLAAYGGAPDSEYTQAVGSLFLIAAVRRVRTPGSKFDELLVLESKQGTLKSQALRALCPNEDWFSDDLPLGVDAKQIIERTRGKWIIEASELHGYTNAEVDRLKSMLARQVDGPARMAYGRMSIEVARQFVIAGTTNMLTEYLKDSTGNRRFWPVTIEQFDVDAIKRDRDQLWAEAAYREAIGASIRLPERLWEVAAVEQEARRQVDPWEELLDSDDARVNFSADAIPVEQLWIAIGDAGKYRKPNDSARLARIVQRHGFKRKKKIDSICEVVVLKLDGSEVRRIEAKRQWAWVRDEDVARIEWTRTEHERSREEPPF